MSYKKRVRYSPAIGRKICGYIEDKMTITQLCKLPDMPDRRNIHRWRHKHDEFEEIYVRAEQIRLSFLVDEMLELTSGSVIKDLMRKNGVAPDKLEVHAEMHMRRLRVDVIKFLAAKLYGGDRGQGTVVKSDNIVNVVNYSPKVSDDNLMIQSKPVIDLQPQRLKSKSLLTVAQQAQVDMKKKNK